MGCEQSTAAGNHADRDRAFRKQVSDGNVLAIALQNHWRDFVKENELKMEGNTAASDKMRSKRQSSVKVNHNPQQAKSQNLTFETASSVADNFLGYAMTILGNKNWGGSVRHNLRGAPSRESSLTLNGNISFTDNNRNKFTVPYNVDMIFFLC